MIPHMQSHKTKSFMAGGTTLAMKIESKALELNLATKFLRVQTTHTS